MNSGGNHNGLGNYALTLRRNPGQRGFSLVEVMVVSAVIALLVALVLPALGHGRDVARRAMCASNLRQVGVILKTYTLDAKYYPYGEEPTIDGGKPDPTRYRYRNLLANVGLIPTPAFLGHGSQIGQGLVCPSWQKGDVADSYGYFRGREGTQAVGGNAENINSDTAEWTKWTRIKQPGQTLMMVDAKPALGKGCLSMDAGPAGLESVYTDRHLGGFGLLWVDGHIENQPANFFTPTKFLDLQVVDR